MDNYYLNIDKDINHLIILIYNKLIIIFNLIQLILIKILKMSNYDVNHFKLTHFLKHHKYFINLQIMINNFLNKYIKQLYYMMLL